MPRFAIALGWPLTANWSETTCVMLNPYPKHSMEWYLREYDPAGKVGTSRHDKTQFNVRRAIAGFVKECAPPGGSLVEIGAFTGWHTVAYRDQITNPQRTVIYDWMDCRTAPVREIIEFKQVDLETDRFPDSEGAFDVVICNQVFEHLKNIFQPLSEIHNVLKPGGHLILSVPNISALHNCALILFGRQPTTMRIMDAHVRGFALWSFGQFLEWNGHFRIKKVRGFGLHPFTSMETPGFLRTYCHTPVWLLEKQISALPKWDSAIKEKSMTTNYF